ncbi:hypothetical protein RRG08_053815 [Elysia crispata]|uniref:Uncharacterized protein n=1 Tax=Elysia crispata TaxID=231223 RepID=A0AAE0Z4B3_9GAST|nr:hypothetical protein RRG08_053815 [Elysia crispata]
MSLLFLSRINALTILSLTGSVCNVNLTADNVPDNADSPEVVGDDESETASSSIPSASYGVAVDCNNVFNLENEDFKSIFEVLHLLREGLVAAPF